MFIELSSSSFGFFILVTVKQQQTMELNVQWEFNFREERLKQPIYKIIFLVFPVASRKLLEQENSALKIDSSEAVEDQTGEGEGSERAEDNQEEGKLDTTKKSNVSRGESKQSHLSQDTGKKTDGKKSTAGNKELLAQTVPDLEEDELCRDCAMIAISMGTAVTGAKIKGVSLYDHLAKVFGKEVF